MTWIQQSGRFTLHKDTMALSTGILSLDPVTKTTTTSSHKMSSYGATVRDRSKRSKQVVKNRQGRVMENVSSKPQITSHTLKAPTMSWWRNQSSPYSMPLSCLRTIGQSMSSMMCTMRIRMAISRQMSSVNSTVPMFKSRKILSILTVQMMKSLTMTFANVLLSNLVSAHVNLL